MPAVCACACACVCVRQGGVLSGVAEARVDINATRLLCLQAAHSMDTVGNKVAKDEIAMIKVRR